MTVANRPNPIKTILKTLDSGDDPYSAELEIYIAELEAKQPVRPSRITAILTSIGLQYSADIETTLEAYISDLESKQQTVSQESDNDPENLPVWSHERAKKRAQHRRERALKKLNNYQGIKPL